MNSRGWWTARVRSLALVGFLTAARLVCPSAAAPPPTPAPGTAVVLGAEGTVEFLSKGATRWHRAYAGQTLDGGDQIRTGPRSRALLRFSNRENFRLAEHGLLAVPEESRWRGALELLRGAIYFFHRDKPDQFELRTRVVQAVVRGTECALRVAEDGTTTFDLLDGELWLTNAAGVLALTNGQSARVLPGAPPVRTAAVEARAVIQWCLYYPNVLDVDAVAWPEPAHPRLAESLAAFRRGHLPAALEAYPSDRTPASLAERLYLAALVLSAGQVTEAESLLDVPGEIISDPVLVASAAALRLLVQTVQGSPPLNRDRMPDKTSASGWLAESYVHQAQGDLESARAAARESTRRAPAFSYAWARLAELEFSFGRRAEARAAVQRALELGPGNAQAIALRGFLIASDGRLREAELEFSRALEFDAGLGNAWLGRGLTRLAQGRREAALGDLQAAATVEPQRAALRSCLGKALALAGDRVRAGHEFDLAKALDPRDPTAWFYAALLQQTQNRLNSATRELQHSQTLNDNRQVYRSRLLLDQDQAVRSVSLAELYRDVGLDEVALREASQAVSLDYANYSAHLFLADAYDRRRDPRQLNLRYESAWLSEYLMANLLAPAAGGIFSPNLSQQEYSHLFERRPWGVASTTDYSSNGDWRESAAHYGNLGRLSYSLEGHYQSFNGQRINNELETSTLWARTRWQLAPGDSVWLEAIRFESKSGDERALSSPREASRSLRVREREEPLLLAGYHHEWAPGMHTVALVGRLEDHLSVTNAEHGVLEFDPFFPAAGVYPHAQDYRNRFEIYSGELQQIVEYRGHRVIAGGRFQAGTFFTDDSLDGGDVHQRAEADMAGANGYLYWSRTLADALTIVGGVSYDQLRYPDNHRFSPVNDGERSVTRWNPKAGLIWRPALSTSLRSAYAEALGGVSFDQSFRLEPTQVAGINQSYRSLIPESVAGANAAPRFRVAGASLEHQFSADLRVTIGADWLRSRVHRSVGAYVLEQDPFAGLIFVPGRVSQSLDFDERSVLITAHQLLDNEWALGVDYRLGQTDLKSRTPAVEAVLPDARVPRQSAFWQHARLLLVYNHRSGWNARGEAVWAAQRSDGYNPALPAEDFWQGNLFAGYRWPGRRVEARCGVINLTGRDYRLNPLSVTTEPPRERAFVAQLRLSF